MCAKGLPWSKSVRVAASSQPAHYRAQWMPVFSSFVGWGIDGHSPGNDCHSSAKSLPPPGGGHIKRGCQGAPLVNRGNKHLLILTSSSPTALLSVSSEKRCPAWTSFPSVPPSPFFFLLLCQEVLVLTSTQKGLQDVVCVRGSWQCWGSESVTDVNEINSASDPESRSPQSVWTSKAEEKEAKGSNRRRQELLHRWCMKAQVQKKRIINTPVGQHLWKQNIWMDFSSFFFTGSIKWWC